MAVTIPSKMWVFNPTYIDVTGATAPVVVTIGNHSITANTYNGNARILISRLAQLSFTSPDTERSKNLSVTVSGGTTGSGTILAIWGALGYSDIYGQFARLYGTTKVRRVQYFKNFPFTLDILTTSGFSNRSVTGASTYTITNALNISIKTVVEERDESEGICLRWVDRFGFIQYYVFTAGDIELANTLSSETVDKQQLITGTMYSSSTRPLNVDTKRTYKLCAVSLDRDTIEYVSSIVGSPIVDMFINSSWLPVVVSAGTYKYSQHHLKHRQDFEISVELPVEHSQKL